jgi:hypothetical protein
MNETIGTIEQAPLRYSFSAKMKRLPVHGGGLWLVILDLHSWFIVWRRGLGLESARSGGGSPVSGFVLAEHPVA